VDSTADTYAQFVRWLSGHLDDHDTRSDGVAAAMYVSRSLLDRLVKAAAGESTARFRRRLLLERAAYRLRTTDVSIIDGAVEAGFSSGEAFARAFRRAYGESPTAWRDSGKTIHIGPSNRVHFFPPGGLRLPATSQETAMAFVAELFDHHTAVLTQLLERAGTLADAQLDAPIAAASGIDSNPTIRSLLARLVGQTQMWGAAMASVPYDHSQEQDETIGSMRARLERAGRDFVEYVRDVCANDRFGETYVDATGPTPYVFTAAGMIGHVLTYAAYRRTVVVSALEAAGAGEVADDPLEWFAP
jgi:AraC family transcriptional regulator